MKPLIVALGNRLRGDDAAGPLTLDALARLSPAGIELREGVADALELVDALAGRSRVIVVDACRIPRQPVGALFAIADAARCPERLAALGRPCSSHAFELAEVVELARTLGCLPARLDVWGIVGAEFGLGKPPSPAVVEAASRLAGQLAEGLAGGDPQSRSA
ncbi:MAG: hydrogenase maturation protease [Porticoccaceae bacterium]|nr:MAG: hydrogenase maturation protease [Porticoccaceae bacterium]